MNFKTPMIKRTFAVLAGSSLAIGGYQLGQSAEADSVAAASMRVCTSPLLLPQTLEEYETAKKYASAHYDGNAKNTRIEMLLQDVTERLNRGEEVTVKLEPASAANTETLIDGSTRQSLCYVIR